jgi:hypothetical protein
MSTESSTAPPAELSPRVVPRTAEESPAPLARSYRRGDDGHTPALAISWRSLVLAVWELDDGWQYTGELPAGLTPQHFWGRVGRAARRMHGEVGIAVRGRRWWAWTVRRPEPTETETTKTTEEA